MEIDIQYPVFIVKRARLNPLWKRLFHKDVTKRLILNDRVHLNTRPDLPLKKIAAYAYAFGYGIGRRDTLLNQNNYDIIQYFDAVQAEAQRIYHNDGVETDGSE